MTDDKNPENPKLYSWEKPLLVSGDPPRTQPQYLRHVRWVDKMTENYIGILQYKPEDWQDAASNARRFYMARIIEDHLAAVTRQNFPYPKPNTQDVPGERRKVGTAELSPLSAEDAAPPKTDGISNKNNLGIAELPRIDEGRPGDPPRRVPEAEMQARSINYGKIRVDIRRQQDESGPYDEASLTYYNRQGKLTEANDVIADTLPELLGKINTILTANNGAPLDYQEIETGFQRIAKETGLISDARHRGHAGNSPSRGG